MKQNRFILILLSSLLTVSLLGCGPNVARVGTLADTGDVYYLTIPGNPPADVSVYIPVAKYEDFLTVHEHVTPEFTVVKFGAGYKQENSIEIDILPKHSKFVTFVRRAEHLTLAPYKNNPDVIATQIYQQETTLDHHQAFYNVYTVQPAVGEADEVVIIQYIVNYQHHYANIKFFAHEGAFTDPIKSPRRAIEKTFAPANEYFRSFRLRYESMPAPSQQNDHDSDDKSSPRYRGA